jgi:hypothetical protein
MAMMTSPRDRIGERSPSACLHDAIAARTPLFSEKLP